MNKEKESIEGEKLIRNAVDVTVIKKGGVRPGAGRPRGSKNPLTKKVGIKEKTIKERVLKNVDDLVTSQIALAKGLSYLYKINMKNVNGRRKAIHILVTNPKEIQEYLDGDRGDEEYYYITAEKPDNRAIDSLLDRAFGKAGQTNKNEHELNVNIISYEEKPKIASGEDIIRDITPDDNDTSQLPPERLSAGVSPSETEI